MDNSPKYPRTYHAPWSEGGINDDKIQKELSNFLNVPLIVTEKMDGSNVTLEHDACYARTHSGPPTHPSFDAFKRLHAELKYAIPDDAQICGEWLYAKHSISYSKLPNYFMMFGVRELRTMRWLSWEWVEYWAEELGVPTVPVLNRTMVKTIAELKELATESVRGDSMCGGEREGVVIRTATGYHTDEFPRRVLKMVRANHVQTTEHWKNQEIVRNLLA